MGPKTKNDPSGKASKNYKSRGEQSKAVQNWKLLSMDMLERIPVITGHKQAANMWGYGSLGTLGGAVIICS